MHAHAEALRDALREGGVDVADGAGLRHPAGPACPVGRGEVVDAALAAGVNLWRVDDDTVQLSVDETTDLVDLGRGRQGVRRRGARARCASPQPAWPEALVRTSDYLTHPVFSAHHSETAMLRYLRRLADRDFALDRGMIPLGSCTMKLNATTEMVAVTWPEFAQVHPFAPHEQTRRHPRPGRRARAAGCARSPATTPSRCSRTPGRRASSPGCSPSRAYHRSRGDDQRTVCLIPSSAHGTNAASAVMAGLRVVVVKTDPVTGNVDLDDLKAKVEEHRDTLAAIMVTYPSTHGVFEDTITDLCALVHDAGGQVYVDGANLNALVGRGPARASSAPTSRTSTCTRPSASRTAAAARASARSACARTSRRSCPTTRSTRAAGPATGVGPISAAPYGSASILPISWAYVRLMGGAGLRRATEVAVLNANYVAARLREHYPVLYSGHDGLVAHECILDLRGITKDTGVTVDDVAKRLIDYGFHAPTMSFPVAGTLMVEPTESEDKGELDRFCDAMIAIRGEIDEVGSGAVGGARQRAARRPAHGRRPWPASGTTPTTATAAAFPEGVDPHGEVLAAGAPHRRRLRRPPPRLLVPVAGGVRGLTDRMPAGRLRRPARPPARRPAPRRCCRRRPCARRPGG